MIDWSKPIEVEDFDGLVTPARFVGTRKCNPNSTMRTHIVAVDYGLHETVMYVKESGECSDYHSLRNVPPPTVKIPYVVAKFKGSAPYIYTDPGSMELVRKGGDWIILSEGVLEVEDK